MTPSLVSVLVAELEQNAELRATLRDLLDDHPDGQERLLTTREAADRLSMHPKTISRLARDGRIRGACKIGPKLWRFSAAELEVLPVHRDLSSAGVGRARRSTERSTTTKAILDAGGLER